MEANLWKMRFRPWIYPRSPSDSWTVVISLFCWLLQQVTASYQEPQITTWESYQRKPIKPKGSCCEEMSTAEWACQGSYQATPLHPGCFLWACHSNDCRSNVVTGRAEGITGSQKSKPPRKTPHFPRAAILEQVFDSWWLKSSNFFKKYVFSLFGFSWVCV